MRPLTITREIQIAFYEFNTRVARARADYAAHPTEFNKARYCIECSEEKPRTRTALRCALCEARQGVADAS